MRKDSLEMTDDDRALIRRLTQECAEECVLITHGTDGMVATGKALRGIADKRIVLTGALQPAAFHQSDAIFNIGCALGAVQSKPAGVYIAMNGQVFDVDRVAKNLGANRFEVLT
jgi:L-asparaginase